MFYSDRRTSGAGFRLDTTCFQPSVQRQQNEVALGNEVKQHSRRSISICMQLCTTTGFDRLTCMHSYIQTNQNENCTAIGETSPFAKVNPQI